MQLLASLKKRIEFCEYIITHFVQYYFNLFKFWAWQNNENVVRFSTFSTVSHLPEDHYLLAFFRYAILRVRQLEKEVHS